MEIMDESVLASRQKVVDSYKKMDPSKLADETLVRSYTLLRMSNMVRELADDPTLPDVEVDTIIKGLETEIERREGIGHA